MPDKKKKEELFAGSIPALSQDPYFKDIASD